MRLQISRFLHEPQKRVKIVTLWRHETSLLPAVQQAGGCLTASRHADQWFKRLYSAFETSLANLLDTPRCAARAPLSALRSHPAVGVPLARATRSGSGVARAAPQSSRARRPLERRSGSRPDSALAPLEATSRRCLGVTPGRELCRNAVRIGVPKHGGGRVCSGHNVATWISPQLLT